MKKRRKYSANPVRKSLNINITKSPRLKISNGTKRILRKKSVLLPKTQVRPWHLATRLEHRRVEGKRKK